MNKGVQRYNSRRISLRHTRRSNGSPPESDSQRNYLRAGRGRRLRPPEELIGAYYEHPGRTMKYLCLAYGD